MRLGSKLGRPIGAGAAAITLSIVLACAQTGPGPGGGDGDGDGDGDRGDAGGDSGALPAPFAYVDDVGLYINFGDSFGAGYNASSGRGYAPLLDHNNAAYPGYGAHHLQARFSGGQLVNRAESGATSDDVVGQSSSLPDVGGRDVIATIYVGGNDFNDELATMLFADATAAAIENWRANLESVVGRLRAAYDNGTPAQELVVLIATIHDPTDGTGSIPPRFDDGFCGTIGAVPAGLATQALENLAAFNAAIRDFAADGDSIVLDSNALFIGHGMNAPDGERWLDDDCAHGTNEGHHQVRREIWRLLSGELH